MTLSQFLQTKPLYYDRIDLERMPGAYAQVRRHLCLGKVVHLVGTNGKGSTGRMLAEILRSVGLRVGHYSSPHILRFNERIWIDGAEVKDETLETAHEKLMAWLQVETAEDLSYFEYTTLLALVVFEGCDAVVLEAGLGGEFDATNVVPKSLSVVTPIGYDHQAFLGDTIEAIAATKVRSVENRMVLAPQPHEAVYEVAERIAREKGLELIRAEEAVDTATKAKIAAIAKERGWPDYLYENGVTAVAAYETLRHRTAPVGVLRHVRLKGRFQRLRPDVIVDVGHNPLAAEAVAKALNGEKRVLVYNALADKEAEEVLRLLAPVTKRLEVIDIESERTMDRKHLTSAARNVGLPVSDFEKPKPGESYLVFGSFYVVEAFLRRFEGVS